MLEKISRIRICRMIKLLNDGFCMLKIFVTLFTHVELIGTSMRITFAVYLLAFFWNFSSLVVL